MAAVTVPDGEGFGYMEIEEIMSIYSVSRGYAYRLACQLRWGRYRHPGGRVRYRREHVHDTLSAGAARRRLDRSGKVQT